MNFCTNNENAAVLKIIKASKNCHDRFTVKNANFLKVIQCKETLIQFYTHLLKDLKDVKVKLRFSALSTGIAEIEQTQSSPRPFLMTLKSLKWWGPTGCRTHSA